MEAPLCLLSPAGGTRSSLVLAALEGEQGRAASKASPGGPPSPRSLPVLRLPLWALGDTWRRAGRERSQLSAHPRVAC